MKNLVKAILFTTWAVLLGLGMVKNITWLIWPMLAVFAVGIVYMVIVGLEMMS